MKRLVCFMTVMLIAGVSFAQTDSSSSTSSDTVKVGNFIIIKKNKGNTSSESVTKNNFVNIEYTASRRTKRKNNISTNWFIFDLGFANYRDNTDYSSAQAGNYFKTFRPADGPVNQNSYTLNTGKSSNVNIWFFMQKMNLIKHVVNLKYGLGLEMYNFRYDSRISFRKDPVPYVYNDSISFSKNKLYWKSKHHPKSERVRNSYSHCNLSSCEPLKLFYTTFFIPHHHKIQNQGCF